MLTIPQLYFHGFVVFLDADYCFPIGLILS